MRAVNISGTFNTLSKLEIFGRKWQKKDRDNFKSLIIKLVEEAQKEKVLKTFNSQHIANILNALSKWDVLDNQEFKTLIVNLIEQGNEQSFNSQAIANILNALSKWDVLDNQEFKASKDKFKTLIVNLIKQGNEPSTQFNSQEIANILNALSKWDVLDEKKWEGKVKRKDVKISKVALFKELIVNLIEQGNKPSTQFNSQDIANILNALSKWDVLDEKKWEGKVKRKDVEISKVALFKELIINLIEQGNEQSFNSQAIANTYDALYKFNVLDSNKWSSDTEKFKSFIIKLAEKGKKIPEEFNSQEIANTFHAFSNLDIFNKSKWKDKEQDTLKFFIISLANMERVYTSYTLKDISRTYDALLNWNGFFVDEFEGLIDSLKKRVTTIAIGNHAQPEDIRFISKIIDDLPKLKSKGLIEPELLFSLIQCLSASVNNSKADDLKDNWSKKNILSGLQVLYEIVSKEDRSGLKEAFDKNLSEIHNKLVELKVSYASDLQQLTVKLRAADEDCKKTYDKQIPASNLNYNAKKKDEDNQLLHELFSKDVIINQGVEVSSAGRDNSLQDDKMGYTTGGYISVVREYISDSISSLFNYMKGHSSQAIASHKQTTDTEDSQPCKAVVDKFIEAVKQIISERVGSEESNINFKQMKKKINKAVKQDKVVKQDKCDGILESIVSRIFEEGTQNLKAKLKNVEYCKQIVGKKINPLIQEISKNRNSTLEVNDVKEQQINLGPKSYLNDASIQGHLTQDRDLSRISNS